MSAYVLVIDDDPTICEVIAEIMTLEGYRVNSAANGDGLALALAEPPDLIILDLMMEGLDGPAVIAGLQADPRTAGIPVIILSARFDGYERAKALGKPHMSKPFSMAHLVELVAQLLKEGRHGN